MKRNRKVLLVSNFSILSEEVILYCLNLSERMEASLEVLHILQPDTTDMMTRESRANIMKMEGGEYIEYSQLFGDEDCVQGAIKYAKNKRNLLCVIFSPKGEEELGNKGRRQKKFKEINQLLHCPVVLYTDSPVYL